MDIFQRGLGILQGDRIGKIEGRLGEIERRVEKTEDKYIFELYTIL
jgi:tetrahydromethanopterin S-methyltransferase subunit G